MTDARWQNVKALFQAAVERKPSERAAFLADACADDDNLRRDVESLLAQDASSQVSLESGRRIGVYQVLAPLGAGGMGEVYRARDTRLGRDVAIKILPAAFTDDPDRLARFEREARMLAALNHPQIAAIYGVEEADGVRALVLELVEGETLADRIASRLPVKDALEIARQIADALDAAHEKGIVHRDLKPANIKIRPDGVVKVLDFGIAKLTAHDDSHPKRTGSPTITIGGTREGVILGTAAYMSPEQARGLPVDKRTDIWAFGCVLYEMLTGRAAFGGETVSDTIAALLERTPDWSRLPAATPAPVRRLLERSLRKDQRDRLRDIGDARTDLAEALGPPRTFRIRRVAALLLVAAALTAVGAATYWTWTRSDGDRSVARLSISAPGTFTAQTSVAVSPDGRRLAFVSTDATGRSMLWVRELDSLEPRVIAGTEDAAHPFWSPDGKSIGFLAGGKLKRVDLDGAGGVLSLASTTIRSGGAWSRRGVILFKPRRGELASVSATGGPVVPVQGTSDGAWPTFLPDSTHFVVFDQRDGRRGIYAGSLDSQTTTFVMPSDFKAIYAEPGYLFTLRDQALFAYPFDAGRLAVTGDPISVAQGVWGFRGPAQAGFSLSRNGVLAYVNSSLFDLQLNWISRSGRPLGLLGSPDRMFHPQLSPDGARVAIARGAPAGEDGIWSVIVDDGRASRLTLGPDAAVNPVWSSDGRRLLLQRVAADRRTHRIVIADARGSGQDDLVATITGNAYVWDWSRDERFVVYSVVSAQGAADLWVLPRGGEGRPFPFVQSSFHKTQAQLSPDGHWVAYTSYESGRDEIYVQRFPTASDKQQISVAGGMQPRWRHDGSELFYLGSDQYLYALPVKAGPHFETGAPTRLFKTRLVPQGSQALWFDTAYDVTADGQRFLFTTPPEDPAPPMTVILNWPTLIKKR